MKRLIAAVAASMAIMCGSASANVTTVPALSYREYTGCPEVQVNSIKESSDNSLFIDRTVQFYLSGSDYTMTVYTSKGTDNVVYNELPASSLFTVNNQGSQAILVDKTCSVP